MLPEGFSYLVALVIKDWSWDKLPKNDSDIWDALLYTVFLGAIVRSAQAGYAKEVLTDLLEFKAAQKVPKDPIWSKKALKVLNTELGSIKGTPGEGFKRAILQIVIQQVENLDLSRTIGTALDFFDNQKLNVQKIKSLQNDYKGTLDLTDLAAREIHNIRYIKAVLWLYGCGIAMDLVPPNAHVTRFLNECGYLGFGWSRDIPDDWQIFTPACKCMRDVAKKVATELGRSITPKQAQAAVWYLQTCRGLLPTGHKKELTPLALIDFLRTQKWSIQRLDDKLLNAYTQSGGERSTATMTFLLALQQHVQSPFRAVGEYDIHMDPRNREIIANLLVSSVRGLDAQYLAITPSQVTFTGKDVHIITVQNVEGKSLIKEVTA